MATDYQIGIIGAGIGGLVAALALKRSNRESFVIFERAAEVGGVWRDNTYPGCACDIRSHLYCISESPKADWQSNYASQPEILDYLRDVADAREIYPHIRFNSDIREVAFRDTDGCWEIRDQTGQTTRVAIVILAVGALNRASIPSLPGIERFRGQSWHSSEWDPAIDLTDRRVAVIGTGASAIQIVPNIADDVRSLTVFQRSPPWVLPRDQRRISALEQLIYRRVPGARSLVHRTIYAIMEVIALAILGNRSMSGMLIAIARRKISKEVDDPDLREKLLPDYAIGCKRILVSDDYYPALNRPNVHVATEAIREVVEDGIVTEDGTLHEADRLIFATGFTVADPDGLVRVVGRDGRVLAEQWARDGVQAYLGTTISGYPNLAFIVGPNSGPANSSAIHVMESQVHYMLQYIAAVEKAGSGGFLDVDPDVQNRFNEDLQNRLTKTAWNAGCSNWYIDRQGRNTTMYPGLTSQFRRRTRRMKLSDYIVANPSSQPTPVTSE